MRADGPSPDPIFAPELRGKIGAAKAPSACDARDAAPWADDRPASAAHTHAGELIQEQLWPI